MGTIKDVAELANVSSATVSRILNRELSSTQSSLSTTLKYFPVA